MKIQLVTCIAAGCLFLLPACKDTLPTAVEPPSPPSDQLLRIFSTQPFGEPTAIHTARPNAQPGEQLTLKGRVMGGLEPFVEGRAIFVLGDPEVLKICNEIPDDTCPTPWDNCCNTPEEILSATATVQVVGADDRILRESIEHVAGLEKLSRIVVSGTVAEAATRQNLVLNADAIKVLD